MPGSEADHARSHRLTVPHIAEVVCRHEQVAGGRGLAREAAHGEDHARLNQVRLLVYIAHQLLALMLPSRSAAANRATGSDGLLVARS